MLEQHWLKMELRFLLLKNNNQKVNGPGLTPEDKISYKKQVLNAVANDRGWIKDNNLTKQNGRVVIYRS